MTNGVGITVHHEERVLPACNHQVLRVVTRASSCFEKIPVARFLLAIFHPPRSPERLQFFSWKFFHCHLRNPSSSTGKAGSFHSARVISSVATVEPAFACHSERSREWSGWGSRDIDGQTGRLSEREVSESNLWTLFYSFQASRVVSLHGFGLSASAPDCKIQPTTRRYFMQRVLLIILAGHICFIAGRLLAGDNPQSDDELTRVKREYADVLALEGTSKG